MRKHLMAAIITAFATATAFAPAETHGKPLQTAQDCVANDSRSQCWGVANNRAQRRSITARGLVIDKPQEYVKPRDSTDRLVTRQAHEHGACPRGPNGGSTSLARIVEPLKSKIEEIVRECGAIVVSTDCRGGVTPNHREHRAVDINMPGRQGPACIYAHLKGWPGGVSTDYWTAPGVRHVHVSYNRKFEWGLRFAHNGGHRHTKELAAKQNHYPVYADDRNGGSQMYAIVDDGSRRGKYKSMKHRRAALAMQKYSAHAH